MKAKVHAEPERVKKEKEAEANLFSEEEGESPSKRQEEPGESISS